MSVAPPNERGEFSSQSDNCTKRVNTLVTRVLSKLGSENGLEFGESDVVALKPLTTAECEAISGNYPASLMYNGDRGELWSLWSPQAVGTQAVRARQIYPFQAFTTGGTLLSGPTLGSDIGSLALNASADTKDVYRNFISYTGTGVKNPVLTPGVWYLQLSANLNVSSADAGDWVEVTVRLNTSQTWASGAYNLTNRLVLPDIAAATYFCLTVSGVVIVDTSTPLHLIINRGGDTNPTVALAAFGGSLPDQNDVYVAAVKLGGLQASSDTYTP